MKKILHLAAFETFAVDGKAACGNRHGFNSENDYDNSCTHTLAEVTCSRCRKTKHFRECVAEGRTESDMEVQ